MALDEPGLLIAVLDVFNNEGAGVGGGQHTVFASAKIDINGHRCAYDYSAYYVWDGAASANATCLIPLNKGEHILKATPNSNFAKRTNSNFRYVLLPFSH